MKSSFSLRGKLVLLICFASLLTFAISSFVFFYSIKTLYKDMVYGNLESLLQEIDTNVASSLSSIDKTAKNIVLGNSLHQFLMDGANLAALDEIDQVKLRNNIEKEISNQMLFNNAFEDGLIKSINLYLDDRTIAFLSQDSSISHKDSPAIRQVYRTMQQSSVFEAQFFAPTASDPYLHFAYRISSLDHSNRAVYLIISTHREQLLDKYQSILDYEGAALYLSNKDGTVLLSNNRQMEGSPMPQDIGELCTWGKMTSQQIEGATFLFSSQWLNRHNYLTAVLVPERGLTHEIYKAMQKYLILFVAVVVGIGLIVLYLSLRITAFTGTFVSGLQRFGEGDFTVKLPRYRDSDLDQISLTFNQMTERINTLVEDGYKKQLLIQQMDIALLQSQMNPHFLFNVLFTISTRAKITGDDLQFQMVQALTRLLRASLHKKNEIKVKVSQELEYVQSYLYIQQVRIGERLQYDIFMEEADIADLYIPRLSIQPLVENAVLHGISPLSEPGHISINLQYSGDLLQIIVEDNGAGFDINEPAPSKQNDSSNHIALQNLRDRIRLIYGEAYGVTVQSAPGQGCRAVITLPKDTGGNYAVSGLDCR